ncbi:MAG TPA: nucleotide excision repair endonuclease [Vicinamibacterales bacterium]|nr:nucleotide excision repair endonuclease [Vicinamibacterales bacterium]
MIRDKLLARLATMGDAPDHQVLAAEILGIRGAPPDLAKRLVAQALVVEDRREIWRRAGERICRQAPPTPGVYVLKDADGRALYVGKAVNLRRRLRAHFAERRWRALKPEMSRAAGAEWREVGSEIEALLREAALIHTLQPPVNVQVGAPDLDTRAVPRALLRDVIVVQPSIEPDSVELICAAVAGGWMIQRTRRSGADLGVHTRRVLKFFNVSSARDRSTNGGRSTTPSSSLAPLVFSWLADRGSSATRLDPHDTASASELRRRLDALLADDRLFIERLDQR